MKQKCLHSKHCRVLPHSFIQWCEVCGAYRHFAFSLARTVSRSPWFKPTGPPKKKSRLTPKKA